MLSYNWVQSCRYLGINDESASHFKCNIGEAKKSFYQSFNATFGRVGKIAKENFTVELLMKTCLPTYIMQQCHSLSPNINVIFTVVLSGLMIAPL